MNKKQCSNCFYWQGNPGAQHSECFSDRSLVTHDHSCGDFIPTTPAPLGPEKALATEG